MSYTNKYFENLSEEDKKDLTARAKELMDTLVRNYLSKCEDYTKLKDFPVEKIKNFSFEDKTYAVYETQIKYKNQIIRETLTTKIFKSANEDNINFLNNILSSINSSDKNGKLIHNQEELEYAFKHFANRELLSNQKYAECQELLTKLFSYLKSFVTSRYIIYNKDQNKIINNLEYFKFSYQGYDENESKFKPYLDSPSAKERLNNMVNQSELKAYDFLILNNGDLYYVRTEHDYMASFLTINGISTKGTLRITDIPNTTGIKKNSDNKTEYIHLSTLKDSFSFYSYDNKDDDDYVMTFEQAYTYLGFIKSLSSRDSQFAQNLQRIFVNSENLGQTGLSFNKKTALKNIWVLVEALGNGKYGIGRGMTTRHGDLIIDEDLFIERMNALHDAATQYRGLSNLYEI